MGIQVMFERKSAIEAGGIAKDGVHRSAYYSEDGLIEEFHEWRTFQVGQVKMADYGDDDTIVTDFNTWGDIRPVLKPWLEANHIDYQEI